MLKVPLYSRSLTQESEYAHKNADIIEALNNHSDLHAILPIVKNRFYFATLVPGKKEPRSEKNIYLFDIDDELVYNYFYDDFGPLNIACLYKYCMGVNTILKNPSHEHKIIVHYTSTNPEKRANAAFLVASYAVLCLNKSPEDAYAAVLSKEGPHLRPFQDVSMGTSIYTIKIIDCVRALQKAVTFGFFNLYDFDIEEYEKYEKLSNGDLNWIVPRKFIAFLGPSTEVGNYTHPPDKYIEYFLQNDVAAVIRLNRKAYDAWSFSQAGIMHYEMFFPDGGIPPRKILKNFLHVAETTKGAVAVHCKAGLGRTGTLIAAYLIKHYAMTAKEAISWLRICRPGSVIGAQQSWLEDAEATLSREGKLYRLQFHGDENLIVRHKRPIYSIVAKTYKHDRRKLDSINFLVPCTVKKDTLHRTARSNSQQSKHIRSRSISPAARPAEPDESSHEERIKTQGDKLNERKLKREQKNQAAAAANTEKSKTKTSFPKKITNQYSSSST